MTHYLDFVGGLSPFRGPGGAPRAVARLSGLLDPAQSGSTSSITKRTNQ